MPIEVYNTTQMLKAADGGCDNAEAKAHFQRYRIYAGKTR